MKVALVMPMSPESVVAQVMVQALSDIASRWDVDVWCPAGSAYRPCPVLVRPFDGATADVIEALRAYDLVVYAFGNNSRHERIARLALAVPGLVVLHDVSSTATTLEAARSGDRHARRLGTARRMGDDALTLPVGEVALTDVPELGQTPYDEVALDEESVESVVTAGSLGIVVHSSWHAARVDGMTLGEVTVAPLPVPAALPPTGTDDSGRAAALLAGLPADAVLVVIQGAVELDGRIAELLGAVADDEFLRDRVHIWVVAAAGDTLSQATVRLAQALGVGDHLAATGDVSAGSMQAILERADIVLVLAGAELEGELARVLAYLAAGATVVVDDRSPFVELPVDVVVTADRRCGRSDIRTVLRRVADEPVERRRRRQESRDGIEAERSDVRYATALLDAGERALAAKPVSHLTEDLRARLQRLGLGRDPRVVDLVASLAFELFDLG